MLSRFTPLALAALIAGCASTTPSPEWQARLQTAETALTAGDTSVTPTFLAAADGTRGATQQRARLGLARALWMQGDTATAKQQWAAIRRDQLDAANTFEFDLLAARIALAEGRPPAAVAALQQDPGTVPPARREAWLQLRADALAANRDPIGAASALAALATLREGATRATLLRQAERALADASDSLLRQQAVFLPEDDPLLPLLSREMGRRGLAFDRPLPRPTASPGVRPPSAADGYHPPAKIAVLLPLSGELAPAGKAVRDGLLAGYFAETRARPPISFHDTAGTAAGARLAHEQALASGADFLIGPLGRDEVAAIAAKPTGGVRWLALNRLPGMPPGSASFALAPEDDGALVAQRLLSLEMREVLVVAQTGDGPQRTLQGFRDALEAGGGRVTGLLTVDAQGIGQGGDLAALSNKASSQALFISLQAPAARLLLPQLDGVGLGALPRAASSQILTGGNARLDRELDGVAFPALPWLLGDAVGLPDADALARQLPSARGPAARLFAFGFDAWRISGYLEHLQASARTLRGATGELAVDVGGSVVRTPSWAVFANGQPQPDRTGWPLLPTQEPAPAQ